MSDGIVLQWPGPAAHSEFRLAELKVRLKARHADVVSVSAAHVYLVHAKQGLTSPEEARLRELLDEQLPIPAQPAGALSLLVVPRAGTQSPWSSKATDIVHSCGLSTVRRLERGTCYWLGVRKPLDAATVAALGSLLHDRMTESLVLPGAGQDAGALLFADHPPSLLRHVSLGSDPTAALSRANRELGLALSDDEVQYLAEKFSAMGRDPTDAELMMFAQANSEHCRHKIFNARWYIDGKPATDSLFQMIRSTHAASPDGVLSAYKDNAAVMVGDTAEHLIVDPATGRYRAESVPVHTLMKVETHNHPTAISPFPGAATGSGGEIRDEGATGRGARPKAGLTGFTVSNLEVPGFEQPWEQSIGRPDRIASPLQIMLEGPIGAAAFNNEFGRPNVAGYFRTFEQPVDADRSRGYHKPIMIAGGLGNVLGADVEKAEIPVGSLLIVLGGPAMLIGLGGGAASSVGSGSSSADLDFASVQRGNPEMERRAQQVIEACRARGVTADSNPILLIHDVGAGGLSNAVPEVVDHSHRGAVVELGRIPTAETGLSPLELWCNEAQERYVLAIAPQDLAWFEDVCARERCPHAVLGVLDDTGQLVVTDPATRTRPVDMPLEVLLGKPPRTEKRIQRQPRAGTPLSLAGIEVPEALNRVLRMPAVADKSFLIHIGDRTVGGLVSRDQLVGPWQVPVSDVAVTLLGFTTRRGEAMAMGERSPVALLDAPASGRLAVGEALTNILAADVQSLSDIRLSANWMAASGAAGEDQDLYDTVSAVAKLCRDLRIAIPVGKDSLSMQTRWQDGAAARAVVAPVSLIVSAFAPVADAGRTLTPQLQTVPGSSLVLVDLARGKSRLGGSVLAQAFDRRGGEPPDLDEPALLPKLADALRGLREAGLVAAYHDRSDGGLLVSLCEMAFAGRVGLDIRLPDRADSLATLFAEELGVVLQILPEHLPAANRVLAESGLADITREVATVSGSGRIRVTNGNTVVLDQDRTDLHRQWSELSFRMQALRDHPEAAEEAFAATLDPADPGLAPLIKFDVTANPAATRMRTGVRPQVAILREQGVNSQLEMAAAFHRAGFDAVDVHMSDVISGRRRLTEFAGLAVCGGFSYGDVLGAGGGWAKSILYNDRARDEFAEFFARSGTFTLGVCNGCQMLSTLAELIPGTDAWPRFRRNRSEQFEARLSLVEVLPSRSVLMEGMAGSRLLIATSHGEGRASFAEPEDLERCRQDGQLALRYVDNRGAPASRYPANPNGSPEGLAGLCSDDGRVTILMPHPERVHLTLQHSWHPPGWGDEGPWLRLFRNARAFVG